MTDTSPAPEPAFFPNKLGRIALLAFEEIVGHNGLNAVLNRAGLGHWINNYPPGNYDTAFPFTDLGQIQCALEELYGPRGGRGLALRAGRATFTDVLRNFGALAGVGDLAFKVLPLQAKLRIGIPAMARIFSQISDQHSTVHERETDYVYTIHRCPVCWGRKNADKAVCFVAVGLIQEALKWVRSEGTIYSKTVRI